MNSAPMILRLASGSVTPARRARKRSSAWTATSGTLKWSRKAATTWSPSLRRIRPWSTNTHVSWSPTARCTSAAATDESTPPDSPQITRASPTSARIRTTSRSTKEPGVHVGCKPQIRNRKFSISSRPRGVCATSGWNCTPNIGRVSWRNAVTGLAPLRAVTVKPGGGDSTWSPWLIHASRHSPPSKPAKSRRTRELRDQLHSVTDAQYRCHAEQRRIRHRSGFVIYRIGTTAEDDAGRIPLANPLERSRGRMDLTVHPCFAHAPRNQLRVLRPKVKNQNSFRIHPALRVL